MERFPVLVIAHCPLRGLSFSSVAVLANIASHWSTSTDAAGSLSASAYLVWFSCIVASGAKQQVLGLAQAQGQQRPIELQPNPAFERTRTGRPLQALISFWALRVLPARAAQLNVRLQRQQWSVFLYSLSRTVLFAA